MNLRFSRLILVVGVLLGVAIVALLITFTSQKDESADEETAFCDDAGPVFNAQPDVGDVAPDFKLPDHKGGFVSLSDFQGESNVVLIFYPAAWTPV